MSRTVIVGAGVIGLLCAYELRKRDQEVVLLDKGEPGKACSHGNAGWIVPSYSTPLPSAELNLVSLLSMLRRDSPLFIAPRMFPRLAPWLWRFWRHCDAQHFSKGLDALAKLNTHTMARFDALMADRVVFEMHQSGLLHVFFKDTAALHSLQLFETLHRYGYEVPQILRGNELREFEPALSPKLAAGFWVSGERSVRPDSLMEGLTRRLKELGVEILSRLEVSRANRAGRRLQSLTTPLGIIEGDQFVLAAGAWSQPLGRSIGVALPVAAGKGYSITFNRPSVQIHHPIYFGEAVAGCTPFNTALRFAGTMEFSGVDGRVRPDRVRAIRRTVAPYFRDEVRGDTENVWMGFRPVTPDGLPIIGRAPTYDNLYIASGHAMLGITLAPATAVAVANLICHGRTDTDITPFDPVRFT